VIYLKLSLNEVVDLYGSEGTKSHYYKHKRFVSSAVGEALMKTLRQHFNHVVKGKEGRKVYYELLEPKEEVSEREDKRRLGHNRSLPYSEHLDLLIMTTLFESNQKVHYLDETLSSMLVKANAYSENQSKYIASIYKKEEKLKEFNDMNYYIKKDVLNEISTFREQFKRSLNRLQRQDLLDLETHNFVRISASQQSLEETGDEDSREMSEFTISITGEEWDRANEILRDEAKKADLTVYSVLYGTASYKKKEMIEKRDAYIREIFVKKQNQLQSNVTSEYMSRFKMSESRILYMYQSYSIRPKTNAEDVLKLIDNSTIGFKNSDLKNSNEFLSQELNRLRRDYVEEKIKRRYESTKEKIAPYDHPEWGEQDSIERKKAGEQRLEYYDEIESGKALSTYMKAMNKIFQLR